MPSVGYHNLVGVMRKTNVPTEFHNHFFETIYCSPIVMIFRKSANHPSSSPPHQQDQVAPEIKSVE